MSFEINAATLIVGALIFVVGVFVKPLIMVTRDRMVWWYLENHIITNQLFSDIEESQLDNLKFIISVSLKSYLEFDKQQQEYKYETATGSYRVPIKVVGKIESDTEDAGKRIDSDWIRFAKKSSHYDSLIKHYGQDKPNPIENAREKAIKKYETDFSDPSETQQFVLAVLQDAGIELSPLDSIRGSTISYRTGKS